MYVGIIKGFINITPFRLRQHDCTEEGFCVSHIK